MRHATRLSTIACTCTVLLCVAAPAASGKLGGGTHLDRKPMPPPRVHHHHHAPQPPKLTGRALWRQRINQRFGYWGRRLGRCWSVAQFRTALRVVTRESSWCPRAVNGQYHGLFQIDFHHAPRRNLFDPLSNIEAAAQMWGRLGWAPWAATAY